MSVDFSVPVGIGPADILLPPTQAIEIPLDSAGKPHSLSSWSDTERSFA